MFPSNVSVGEAEAEANIVDNTELPCLFRNYRELYSKFNDELKPEPIGEGYGINFYTYYLVFKPFNKSYNKDFNGLDHIRKFIARNTQIFRMLITREIEEKKVHYNVIIKTINPIALHNVNTNKYKIHQQLIPESADHISNTLSYILKESRRRRMIKYKDYYYS